MNARQKAKKYKKELQSLRDMNNPRKEYFATHTEYPTVKLRTEIKVDLFVPIKWAEEDVKHDLYNEVMKYIHTEYDEERNIIRGELWVVKQ